MSQIRAAASPPSSSKRLPLYQVDAFTKCVFKGNPAAVVPLEKWLPDLQLQNIAEENNLAETAFLLRDDDKSYEIRWFTPTQEVDLCGHATLASAHVLFEHLGHQGDSVKFNSKGGELHVRKQGECLWLDFPVLSFSALQSLELSGAVRRALGLVGEAEVYESTYDFLVKLGGEDEVMNLVPDMQAVIGLGKRGVIVTAVGSNVDFVSRFFAPGAGIDEDPVTGSAHCVLIPFWSGLLGKKEFEARQLSTRGGDLVCALHGERALIGGQAVTYMEGYISI